MIKDHTRRLLRLCGLTVSCALLLVPAAFAQDSLVAPPPTIAKAFNPTSIAPGGTSVLTITLTNPGNPANSNVSFTDTYPSGMVNAATPNVLTTCGAGPTLTAVAGAGSLTVSGASIPANNSCTVTVTVTAASSGSYVNTLAAGSVTSSGGSPASDAVDTLTVADQPPSVAKAFNPTIIAMGGTSTLTITLTNPNASTSLTSVAFTDTYPSGMTTASTPNASTTCGGSVTAVAGSGSVALSGGSIAANSNCTVSVDVTSSTAGAAVNTIAAGGVTSSSGANTAPGSATLNVAARPTIAKAFSPNSIALGQNSTLTVTLSNSNAFGLTGAAFTDTYPAGVVNAPTPNGSTTCGGSVTAVAGSGSLALSGGTIPANSTCTVTVTVTTTSSGSKVNTIAAGGLSSLGGTNASSATDTLTVTGGQQPVPTLSWPTLAALAGALAFVALALLKK